MGFLSFIIITITISNSNSNYNSFFSITNCYYVSLRISRVADLGQLQITTARKQVYRYDHVISTATLGLLQQMDTRDLGFDLKKRMATRTLTYEASVKIGLKFRTRWWENAGKMGGKPIRGGQTWTDLPFRKVVYPSHGVDCKDMSGITRLYFQIGWDIIFVSLFSHILLSLAVSNSNINSFKMKRKKRENKKTSLTITP